MFLWMGYSLLTLGSRTPIITLGLVFLVPLFAGIRMPKGGLLIEKTQVIALAMMTACATGLAVLIATGNITWTLERLLQLSSMATGQGTDGSAAERLRYYAATVSYWAESWISVIFGRGVGSFSTLYFGHDSTGLPHNIVLETLLSGGLVAFALFAIFATSVVTWLSVQKIRSEPLMVLLVMLLVHGAFFAVSSGTFRTLNVPLTYMGLLLAPSVPWRLGVTVTVSARNHVRTEAKALASRHERRRHGHARHGSSSIVTG
jgi:hypothetical protein